MIPIALDITSHFSQCETAGGKGKLSVWTRGQASIDPVTRQVVAGPPVAVSGIRGNTAPLTAADMKVYASGKLREGDIQVFTLDEIEVGANLTQDSSMMLLRRGIWYMLERNDDWEYAKGFHYFAFRVREESGV